MGEKKNEEMIEMLELAEQAALEELEQMELNLSDFALFLSVMKNREAHRCVLSIIMDDPALTLTHVHVEEVVLNRVGKRAIRLDAVAQDTNQVRYATEMQNDTDHDSMQKRARYYQGLLDTPYLKAGKRTKYRQLPPTVVTFITQEDIFGKNLAKYTFTEQCLEVEGLCLEDGTTKIFLNMASKNGDPVLVSMLQYMKKTRLDNPEISICDERIQKLDAVVREVKESEEWEAVRMSILSIGMEKGMEQGMQRGMQQGMQKGIQKGIQQGMERGIQKGRSDTLKKMVARKLEKGRGAGQIAEDLELELSETEELIREVLGEKKQEN